MVPRQKADELFHSAHLPFGTQIKFKSHESGEEGIMMYVLAFIYDDPWDGDVVEVSRAASPKEAWEKGRNFLLAHTQEVLGIMRGEALSRPYVQEQLAYEGRVVCVPEAVGRDTIARLQDADVWRVFLHNDQEDLEKLEGFLKGPQPELGNIFKWPFGDSGFTVDTEAKITEIEMNL